MKRALITGITGQDGSYLAEFLLEKGYTVYGMFRRSSIDEKFSRIEHLNGKVELVCGDLLDYASLNKVIEEVKPDEIYNLAAQSDVRVSFDQPFLTNEATWLSVERLLEIVKRVCPQCKFYQASTSELFGDVVASPQNESTPFNPVSPYALAKLRAHKAVQRAREQGMFACSGILFNHESPRRGLGFVTRKVTDGLARIKLGLPQRETGKQYLELGNLDAKRDWGFAGDYVKAMWKILQQDKPKDYVISTDSTHSVREFVEAAAAALDITITWKGEGVNEEGFDQNGNKIIVINPHFYRPREVNYLIGDSHLARKELEWQPEVTFTRLVAMMAQADFERLKKLKDA